MEATKIQKSVVLATISASAVIAAAYLAVERLFVPGMEPFWVLPAFFLPPLMLWLFRKYPPVFLAGLLFVGNFKDKAANGVSVSDPTFILLALTAAAFALDCLLTFALENDTGVSLSRLFTGQKTAILAFLIFFVLIAASYTYCPDGELAMDKLKRLFVFDVLLFFAPLVLLKSEKHFRQLAWAILFLSLALAVRTVLGLGLVGTPNYIDGEDITHISYGQALGITVFILFYFRFTERFSRTIIFISIPWVIVGLIASAARGPILSCLGLLAICSVLMTPHTGILTKKAIRMALISTLVVAAIAVAALEQVPTFKQKFKAKEEQLTAFFEGAQDPGGSTENRLQLWSKAADAISQRPFLGWGVGGWVVFQTDENQGPYPHNMILESGVELGFVGIALLFNFYGNLIAGFRKLLKSNDRRFDFLVPLVIYIFLTSMVSGDMDNRLFWFWCGALFAACRIVAVNKLELVQPSQQPVLAYAG